MVNDPISDLLIQIKNGYLAHKEEIEVPCSKMKEAMLDILMRKQIVGKVAKREVAGKGKLLNIRLLYQDKKAKLTDLVRVSKPGRKFYAGKHDVHSVMGGYGFAIISTSKGLMTDEEARKAKVGGEIVCKIW